MVIPKEILLVEDSANHAELTLCALQDAGLKDEIVAARDGAEALDYFAQRGRFAERMNRLPTLVLLDLKLPKINGFGVLTAIKTDDRLKDIPVVVLTSSCEDGDLAPPTRAAIQSN